jgi:hypothetical protein
MYGRRHKLRERFDLYIMTQLTSIHFNMIKLVDGIPAHPHTQCTGSNPLLLRLRLCNRHQHLGA